MCLLNEEPHAYAESWSPWNLVASPSGQVLRPQLTHTGLGGGQVTRRGDVGLPEGM